MTEPICDCHLHSFAKTPTGKTGAYAPPQRDIHDYAVEVEPFGITRAVIVQASVDGTDNSRLVEALRSDSKIARRGVAMIDPDTADLQALDAAGVRAIRIQDRARLGQSALSQLPRLATCAASVGWHLELNTEPSSFSQVAALLPRLAKGQLLVLDHIGHVDPLSAADCGALFQLLDSGRVWVKLAPTRVSQNLGQYDDLTALIAQIGANYPNQCIWGSDWPHVMMPAPLPEIPPMLSLCRAALSADNFHRCMWLNPERLYRF